MSSEELSAIAGVVLSLIFSYVPGVAGWYDKLSESYKRLVMAGVLLVVTLGIFGGGCWGWLGTMDQLTCDYAGVRLLVRSLIGALVANQATYLISKRPDDRGDRMAA